MEPTSLSIDSAAERLAEQTVARLERREWKTYELRFRTTDGQSHFQTFTTCGQPRLPRDTPTAFDFHIQEVPATAGEIASAGDTL